MEEVNYRSTHSVKWFLILSIAILLYLVNPIYLFIIIAFLPIYFIINDYRVGLFILIALSFAELAALGILETYRFFLFCFVTTFVSFILHNSRNVKLEFNTSIIDKWLFVFFIVVLFSGIYAETSEYWSLEFYDFVRAFILFFLILQGIDNEKLLFLVGKIIVFALFFSSLLSLFIAFRSDPNFFSVIFFRFQGAIADPNDYAMIICGGLPLAVFCAKYTKNSCLKVVYVFISVCFLLFVILTRSRGGFIAATISLVFISYLLFRKRILLATLFIAGLSILVYLTLPQIFLSRIIQFFDIVFGKALRDPSMLQRMHLLNSALAVFSRNPVFGVGANNFISHSVQFMSRSQYVHNMFLEVAVGLGLLGFIPFTVIVLGPFFYFPRMIESSDTAHRLVFADFIRYIRISLIGMLVASLFLSCPSKVYLWVILALIYVAERLSRQYKVNALYKK